jgi:hypothetical protein
VQLPPTLNKRTGSHLVVLRMNLFDRFTRVAKANLNNVLKNLEDPEKIMSQALEDMQVSMRSDNDLEVCRISWMIHTHT